MKRKTFWVITIVLALLALGAATGITEVEHGHGINTENRIQE